MSEPKLPTVLDALVAVMKDVGAVRKGGFNPQGSFNFRGIDDVINACSPAFKKHGIIAIPDLLDYQYGEIQVGKNRTPMGHARVTVAYQFFGPQGDHVTAKVPGEAFDSGDKATAKAMSVALRTALLQTLALPTDEPDPDQASYERSEVEDPALTAAKNLVVESWQKHHGEFSVDNAAKDFGTWSDGEVLADATPDRLREYAAHLAAEPEAGQPSLPEGGAKS